MLSCCRFRSHVAVGFGSAGKVSRNNAQVEPLLLKSAGILSDWKVVVSERVRAVEIACDEVRRELVDYMEEDLKMDLRLRIDQHLENCQHCTAIYDGVRNVVELVGAQGSIELPRGFTQRLHRRFLNQIK